jgi:hypothetical protein
MPEPGRSGAAVLIVTLVAVLGPPLGVSAAWITVGVLVGLVAITVDAAAFAGMGGHVLAETLPGGLARLRRIAIHEAGHGLVAETENLPMGEVLVGSLACLRAGRNSLGSTALEPPAQARLGAPDLRRWSRVLQAGMVAEELIYGDANGGADDRALLGRLWGLSGYDAETAQREQRQARREVMQRLREERAQLEERAERLLIAAPRLGRAQP